MTDENIFSIIYNAVIALNRINNKIFSIRECPLIRRYTKEVREQVISYLGEELGKQRAGGPKAPQWDLLVMFKEQHGSQCGWSKGSKGVSGRRDIRG